MGKTKEHSVEVRQKVFELQKSGKGFKKISKQLKTPISTIRAIVKKFKATGDVRNQPGRGPVCKLTRRTVRRMVRVAKESPRITAGKLQRLVLGSESLQNYHQTPPTSPQVVLEGCQKKASAVNQLQTKAPTVCQMYVRLSMGRVIWSDAPTIKRFGNKHQRWVWRRQKDSHTEKHLIPNVKYGGRSLMLWGCFSSKGPGHLVRIHGIMDSIKYQQILNENLTAPSSKLEMGRGWTFQQDNDPKHTSKSTQKCFTDRRIKVLTWPSQSTDLNPIENLWDELKPSLQTLTSESEGSGEILYVGMIPCHVFTNLITHYRRRLRAVILAKGGCTKY